MPALLALPEGGEWIVILLIVVLVFGANKLPDVTRNVGRALVEFRKATGKTGDPVEKTTAGTPEIAPGTAEETAEKPKQDSPPA